MLDVAMQNTPVLSAPRVDHDKKIGEGGFGSVYATNVQGIVAKVAHESPAIDLAHEAHILSRVSGHESIPSFHGLDSFNLTMFMSFCNGRPLSELPKEK